MNGWGYSFRYDRCLYWVLDGGLCGLQIPATLQEESAYKGQVEPNPKCSPGTGNSLGNEREDTCVNFFLLVEEAQGSS